MNVCCHFLSSNISGIFYFDGIGWRDIIAQRMCVCVCRYAHTYHFFPLVLLLLLRSQFIRFYMEHFWVTRLNAPKRSKSNECLQQQHSWKIFNGRCRYLAMFPSIDFCCCCWCVALFFSAYVFINSFDFAACILDMFVSIICFPHWQSNISSLVWAMLSFFLREILCDLYNITTSTSSLYAAIQKFPMLTFVLICIRSFLLYPFTFEPIEQIPFGYSASERYNISLLRRWSIVICGGFIQQCLIPRWKFAANYMYFNKKPRNTWLFESKKGETLCTWFEKFFGK